MTAPRNTAEKNLEITPRGIAKISLDGTILTSEENLASMLGFDHSRELVGTNLNELLISDIGEFKTLQSLFETLSNGNYIILHIRHKQGRRLIVQITGSIGYADSEEYFEGLFKDITPQRELQEQVQYELEISSLIVDKANIIIGVADRYGNIVEVNPKALEIFEYSRNEVIGKNYWDLFVPKEFRVRDKREVLRLLAREGYLVDREISNITKSGKKAVISWNASALKNRRGEITNIIAMGIDVTEKKQLREQLVQSEKLSAIGQLAAGIAHEIGHPISSISSVIQLLQEVSADDYARGKLALVEKELFRLHRTVQSLIELSRPSKMDPEIVNINQIIEEAVRVIRYDKRIKHRRVILRLDPDLPSIKSAFDKMLQVFINMFLNAADAMETCPGGGLYVTTTNTTKEILISIRDEGIGIPGDMLNHIFEPFITTKKEGKGTGLGLWVCYNIIRSHKGTIEVHSTPGEGTEFIIKLPIKHRD